MEVQIDGLEYSYSMPHTGSQFLVNPQNNSVRGLSRASDV
jgi:hypothetical protein